MLLAVVRRQRWLVSRAVAVSRAVGGSQSRGGSLSLGGLLDRRPHPHLQQHKYLLVSTPNKTLDLHQSTYLCIAGLGAPSTHTVFELRLISVSATLPLSRVAPSLRLPQHSLTLLFLCLHHAELLQPPLQSVWWICLLLL